MSRKYKFHSPEAMYFVSFATVKWISIFIRLRYFKILTDSLSYCIENDKMCIYAFCIMPNHMHLIFSSPDLKPTENLREFKRFTSKEIKKCLQENTHESRTQWLRELLKSKGNNEFQLWQHNNQPIILYSNKVIKQKLNYIHMNPVKSGFVLEPRHWRFSSARQYYGESGEIDIEKLDIN